ncbi:MAG: hypothetical protein AAF493_21605 [Pseudomonadota bacterium]
MHGRERNGEQKPKITSFGEPLWLDIAKTLGVALTTLAAMLAIGVFLGLMIIAPWGRASHDCSMFCVMANDIRHYFGESVEPSERE